MTMTPEQKAAETQLAEQFLLDNKLARWETPEPLAGMPSIRMLTPTPLGVGIAGAARTGKPHAFTATMPEAARVHLVRIAGIT